MVGVAGKSKGCATCRRRKIRCDQGQPTCQQCTKSKRVCEGYSRFPVFIVHTVDGVAKRKPLEEIKPAGTEDTKFNSSRDTTKTTQLSRQNSRKERLQFSPSLPLASSTTLEITSSFNTHSNRHGGHPTCLNSPGLNIDPILYYANYGVPDPSSILPIPFLHTPTLEKTQVVSWAYNIYSRTNDAKNRYNHTPVMDWFRTMLYEATSDPALDAAIFAISARMFGVKYGDKTVIKSADSSYTKGLGALQRNLGMPDAALMDETLASSCAMAPYELTDPVGRNSEAWLSHLAGITTLLRARGPHRHRSALARTTLEHIRYNLAQYCIISRQSYGFAHPSWLQDPWSQSSNLKPLEQRVMDYGFTLAEVLERIDQPLVWLINAECISMLVQDCQSAITGIQCLKRELDIDPLVYLETLPKDRNCTGSDSDIHDDGTVEGQKAWRNALEFQNINRRTLRLTATGLQLHFMAASHEVMRTAEKVNIRLSSGIANDLDLDQTTTPHCTITAGKWPTKITAMNNPCPFNLSNTGIGNDICPIDSLTYTLHDTATPIQESYFSSAPPSRPATPPESHVLTLQTPTMAVRLAKLLVIEMEDIIRDGKGAIICGRLRFPLRIALDQLRREPSCYEYIQGEYLMQALLGARVDTRLTGQTAKAWERNDSTIERTRHEEKEQQQVQFKDHFFVGMSAVKTQQAFDAVERRKGARVQVV